MPYPTPDEPSVVRLTCRRLFIPDEDQLIGILIGQLAEMCNPQYWIQSGTWQVDDLVSTCLQALNQTNQNERCEMIGEIRWTVAFVVPDGWLVADGSIVLASEYPDYAAAVDPALVVSPTEVRLPNLIDRFPVGSGNLYAIDDSGGEDEHTLNESEMPAHSHVYNQPTFNVDVESVGVPDPTGVGQPAIPTNTSTTGGGQAHNNLPPYAAYKPIVRVLP